jgi:hypothetical protein
MSTSRHEIKEYAPSEDTMVKNREELPNAAPVAELMGTEFEKSEQNLFEQVSDFFDNIGNNIYNEHLGDIRLSRSGARDDIAHGVGRLKAATFKAVPDVLEKGAIINYAENHKGHKYDTAIIAAPVNVNGKRHYVAAVVRRDKNLSQRNASQRFYLHEVYTNKKTSELFKSVRGLL